MSSKKNNTGVILISVIIIAAIIYLTSSSSLLSVFSSDCEPIQGLPESVDTLAKLQTQTGLSDSQFDLLISEYGIAVQSGILVQCNPNIGEVSQ